MNGGIRETKVTTTVFKISWSDDGKQRIDRKELAILCKIGADRFETLLNREPEYDNDWWLEWGDERISFCFTTEEEFEEQR